MTPIMFERIVEDIRTHLPASLQNFDIRIGLSTGAVFGGAWQYLNKKHEGRLDACIVIDPGPDAPPVYILIDEIIWVALSVDSTPPKPSPPRKVKRK